MRRDFLLVDALEIRLVRKDDASCRGEVVPDRSETPYIERAEGTGRARCRACGQIIAKGEPVLKFAHSFADAQYSAWTAVDCQIHRYECPE